MCISWSTRAGWIERKSQDEEKRGKESAQCCGWPSVKGGKMYLVFLFYLLPIHVSKGDSYDSHYMPRSEALTRNPSCTIVRNTRTKYSRALHLQNRSEPKRNTKKKYRMQYQDNGFRTASIRPPGPDAHSSPSQCHAGKNKRNLGDKTEKARWEHRFISKEPASADAPGLDAGLHDTKSPVRGRQGMLDDSFSNYRGQDCHTITTRCFVNETGRVTTPWKPAPIPSQRPDWPIT